MRKAIACIAMTSFVALSLCGCSQSMPEGFCKEGYEIFKRADKYASNYVSGYISRDDFKDSIGSRFDAFLELHEPSEADGFEENEPREYAAFIALASIQVRALIVDGGDGSSIEADAEMLHDVVSGEPFDMDVLYDAYDEAQADLLGYAD